MAEGFHAAAHTMSSTMNAMDTSASLTCRRVPYYVRHAGCVSQPRDTAIGKRENMGNLVYDRKLVGSRVWAVVAYEHFTCGTLQPCRGITWPLAETNHRHPPPCIYGAFFAALTCTRYAVWCMANAICGTVQASDGCDKHLHSASRAFSGRISQSTLWCTTARSQHARRHTNRGLNAVRAMDGHGWPRMAVRTMVRTASAPDLSCVVCGSSKVTTCL